MERSPSHRRWTLFRTSYEFLGMVNFYHRFIPRVAQLMRPLYKALKGRSVRHAVDWTAERDKVFGDTKTALANATGQKLSRCH